jgi:hypothetical protein
MGVVIDRTEGSVLYEDGQVTLDRSGITIRRYYFPFATSKRIPYMQIRDVRERRMGVLTGKGRLWGSGDLRHWAALDLGRWRKETAVILDLGRHTRPTFSPDDPERVLAILRERVPRLGGTS